MVKLEKIRRKIEGNKKADFSSSAAAGQKDKLYIATRGRNQGILFRIVTKIKLTGSVAESEP
jgi:hypothetical protein